MNEGLIPKRYAKALYKYACEKGADQGLYRLMGNLGGSFADNPALGSAIANPFIKDAEKISLLETAASLAPAVGGGARASLVGDVPSGNGGGLSADGVSAKAVYSDFLKLLAGNKRLPVAGAVARAYCDIYRKENRIFMVKVVSAQPLGKSEAERLEKLIAAHLRGGQMELSFATDSDLIGGFTVDIDNERLDASVKNELKQLRLKLLNQA